jgi:hypothetical protein
MHRLIVDPSGLAWPSFVRMRCIGIVLLLLPSAILLAASIAVAETVTVTGTTGGVGTSGGFSDPGGPGGDGGDAEVAVGPADPTNNGTAIGGLGGAGGVGGIISGIGGAGGAGGDATADATSVQVSGDATATSTAEAGHGGAGGLGGSTVAIVGGPGGDGGDATASVDASSADGRSDAVVVSKGGSGGTADGPGATAGDGGTGMAIGSATATSGSLDLDIKVWGGSGGFGSSGANGGQGADVEISDASATINFSGETGFVRLDQSVFGGWGGATDGGIAGNGGNAATVVSNSGVGGHSFELNLNSTGGRGGAAVGAGGIAGAGGSASAEATGSFDGGEATVTVRAVGGRGGFVDDGVGSGGDGGDAIGHSTAITSQRFVTAAAHAEISGGGGGAASGVGNRAGDGGTATGTANGISNAPPKVINVLLAPAMANLTLRGGRGGVGLDGADGGDGASVFADNLATVQGDDVSITQRVFGGDASGSLSSTEVIGAAGRAGDATSILAHTVPEGEIFMISQAVGGGAIAGAQAGDSFASADATASGEIWVTAISTAGIRSSGSGIPGIAPAGAIARFGTVRGESTGGGDVRVQATMTGGTGGGRGDVGVDGADAFAIDVVDGFTTGFLYLFQLARAGSSSSFFHNDLDVVGGRGGDATSELNRTKSLEEFEIDLRAYAGDSEGRSELLVPLAGGDALSRANARNDGGSLALTYDTEGGQGADAYASGTTAGAGGTATTDISATTSGNGNDLRVASSGSNSTKGGQGGGGGNFQSIGTTGGEGGLSRSNIVGMAEGDSEVVVESVAYGGWGGRGALDTDGGRGGRGGRAEAMAVGQNSGTNIVLVEATAIGGEGGDTAVASGRTMGGDGGDAESSSASTSLGGGNAISIAVGRGGANSLSSGGNGGSAESTATSSSIGGGDASSTSSARGGTAFSGGGIGIQGTATAFATAYAGPELGAPLSPDSNAARAVSRASGVGTGGSVDAAAMSTGGEIGVSAFRTRAIARTSVSSASLAEAQAGRVVVADVMTNSSDASAFITGPSTVEDEWGRIGLSINSSQVDPGTSIYLEAGFENDETYIAPLAGVFVSFLEFEIGAEEFDEINFRIENEGDVLVDEVFSNYDQASIFFSTVIDLGELGSAFLTQTLDLRFIFGTESATEGARFATVLLVEQVPVPEPGTGMLMIVGLILMSSRRRHEASRA